MNALYPWLGGKSRLRGKIIPHIEESKFYGEPFFGAGWVFFGREHKAKQVEAINDLDGNVVNLLRVVKYHHEALILELNDMLHCQEQWKSFSINQGETDIQRAGRWLMVQKQTWGAKAKGSKTWICDATKHRWTPDALKEAVCRISKRLGRTQITNFDFEKFLKQFDKSSSFFYLDPPYPGTAEYRVAFSWQDQERLAGILKRLKGCWLLSNTDTPAIRKLYKGCTIRKLKAEYRLHRPKKKELFNELLISPK